VELQLAGSMGGRVTALGPDAGCLWCWGILSAERLRAEQLPPELRAEYVGRGYVTDLDVEQPAVVSINGVIASLAVTEMLRRMTGMGGAHDPAAMLLYRLADGTVRRVGRPNGNARHALVQAPVWAISAIFPVSSIRTRARHSRRGSSCSPTHALRGRA
jgi:hypothetical protein